MSYEPRVKCDELMDNPILNFSFAYLLCRKLQSKSCCRLEVVWCARQPAFQTFTT